MPSPAVSASNLRIRVDTLPSPSPASEVLDFLTGAIFVFTSVQGGHTLDHLQQLAPPLKSRPLVFHSVCSLLFWRLPPLSHLAYFLASLSFQPPPPLTFLLVCLPTSCFCFLLHPAKRHAILSLSSRIPSALWYSRHSLSLPHPTGC